MTTTQITTTEPVLCKRCRIGDYVCGDDTEGEYVAGRIAKVSGDLLTVTTRLGTNHELLKYETYKSTKATFDSYGVMNPATPAEPFPPVEVIDIQAKVDELAPADLDFDPTLDAPQPLDDGGLGATSLATEDTFLASETTAPAKSLSRPAAKTKATPPPADGSCPLCGADHSAQTPNNRPNQDHTSSFCHTCGHAWSLKTGREVKVMDNHVRLEPDLTRYVKHDEITASGRKVLDINDPVADALRGLNLEDCFRQTARYLAALGVAATPKRPVTMSGLIAKYGHLNPGMQRMNLGNLLRGAIRPLACDLPEVAFGEDPDAPDA